MADLKRIEREIEDFEGFSVNIHASRRAASNGSTKTPSYRRRHQRRARERHTVDDWKRLRFKTAYPELTVTVVLGNGRVATGKTLLERVRRSYE
jgi:hypothetical protein